MAISPIRVDAQKWMAHIRMIADGTLWATCQIEACVGIVGTAIHTPEVLIDISPAWIRLGSRIWSRRYVLAVTCPVIIYDGLLEDPRIPASVWAYQWVCVID